MCKIISREGDREMLWFASVSLWYLYCYCLPFTDWITYLTEQKGCWAALEIQHWISWGSVCVCCFMTAEEPVFTFIFQRAGDQQAFTGVATLFNTCSLSHTCRHAHMCRAHACTNVSACTHTLPHQLLSINSGADEAVSADSIQHATLENGFLGSREERIIYRVL